MTGSATTGDTRVQKLSYDGRIGSLYWIFIKIVLLNIITASIYRFWGKTRLRAYLWSHVTLQGERIEYTGTGGELFKGFLIVIGLFICANICAAIATAILGPQSIAPHAAGLVFGVVVLYLSQVAIYAAQRYRLTRTSWCGIRGGMSGSAWSYGLRAFGYSLVMAASLGLATPWARMRLAEQRFNNSYFGDAKALLEGRSAPVYKGFLLSVLIYVILMACLIKALWSGFDLGTVVPAFFSGLSKSQNGQLDPEQARMVAAFAAAYGLFILGAVILGIFAFSWYAAAFFKALARGLSFDNLTFRSTMGAWDYFRFWIGNALILGITLGLGFPIIVHRVVKFFTERLEIIGEIDVARLQQNTMPKPKTGEGLLETFDAGFW